VRSYLLVKINTYDFLRDFSTNIIITEILSRSMLDKLYIHIGAHKTGTTAIQRFMEYFRDKIDRELNLYYPKTGCIWSGHHQFAWSMGVKKEGYDDGLVLKKLILDLEAELSTISCDRVLFSSEDFEWLSKVQAQQLKNSLQHIFRQIKIVLYIRRQDSYVEAMYNQQVRDYSPRLSVSFQKYLEEKKYGILSCYDYVERWASVFGRENIIVKPFEKNQFVEGNLFKDFLYALTGEREFLFTDFVLPSHIAEANKALPTEAIDLLRRINQFNLSEAQHQNIVRKLYELEKQDKFNKIYSFFTDAQRLDFVSKYQQQTHKMAEIYCNNLQFFQEIIVPSYREIDSDKVLDSSAALIASLSS
jgi:hypothetical protein